MKQVSKRIGVCAVLGSIFSVQSGASIAKYLFHLLCPGGAVTLRVGLAGIILALINRPPLRHFKPCQWKCVIPYGMSIGFMNLVWYYAIQRIPLGVGVTIEFIGPLALALWKSRRPTDFLWAFLAALGIVFIVPWSSPGEVDLLGVFFALLSSIFWASYIIMTDRITRIMHPKDAVTLGICVASLVVLPAGLISGDLFHLNWKLLGIGFGVAIFSSILPFTLDLYAMKGLQEKTYSILMSLEPAGAALCGFIFVGEQLSFIQCFAILSVIIASIGSTYTSNPNPHRP